MVMHQIMPDGNQVMPDGNQVMPDGKPSGIQAYHLDEMVSLNIHYLRKSITIKEEGGSRLSKHV